MNRQRTLRLPPVQYLLAAACLLSALVLAASEFMTIFEFTPPGGEPLQAKDASEQHSYAPLVIAAFAVGALAIASLTGSKPAATAVAIAGGIALLIFLLLDLPDAGKIGTLDDPRQSFIDAEAVPQEGFWFELLGSLSLAVTGIAYSTLTPEQLVLFRPEPLAERPRAQLEREDSRGVERAEGGTVEPIHARGTARERRIAARRAARRRERG
jgi:hypothetical protein